MELEYLLFYLNKHPEEIDKWIGIIKVCIIGKTQDCENDLLEDIDEMVYSFIGKKNADELRIKDLKKIEKSFTELLYYGKKLENSPEYTEYNDILNKSIEYCNNLITKAKQGDKRSLHILITCYSDSSNKLIYNFERVKEYCKRKELKNDVFTLYYMGYYYYKIFLYEKAENNTGEAIANRKKAREYFNIVIYSIEALIDGKAIFRASEEDKRLYAESLAKLGDMFEQEKEYKNAMACFLKIEKKVPKYSKKSLLKLASYYFLGDGVEKNISKTKEYYEKAMILDDKDSSIFYGLGICSMEENNNKKAIDYFIRATELYHPAALFSLINGVSRGKFNVSVEKLEELFEKTEYNCQELLKLRQINQNDYKRVILLKNAIDNIKKTEENKKLNDEKLSGKNFY